jgi:hypothetical protein
LSIGAPIQEHAVNNTNNAVRFSFKSFASAVALAIALAACGGGGGGSADEATLLRSTTTGESQQQTNASCSYEHVYITVEHAQALQQIDGGEQWIDIALTAPQRIDLISLGSGGVLRALGATPLAAGQYTQIRLVLSSSDDSGLANAVQPTGGGLAPLGVPSGAQTGLKLVGEFNVPVGKTGDVVLEGFDACGAVVQAGSPDSPMYELIPSLAAKVKLVTVVPPETPVPSGTVMPLLGGGYVTVANDFYAGTWVLQRYGADGQPAGAQTTITVAAGRAAHITPLTGGGYAVVWVVNMGTWQGADGHYHSVNQLYAQSFTAAGAPIGSPLPMVTVDPGAVSRPAAVPQLAALTDGGFVVVWGLQRSFGSDTFDTTVYSQRFTAEGAPAGAVQQATTEGTGFLHVTGLTTGGYIVAWGDLSGTEGGVRAYGPDGEPLGPAHAAGPSWGQGAWTRGDLQPLGGGGAVMVWALVNQRVMVQQFAPDGTPLAVRIVNDATATPPLFTWVNVGGLPDGGYVVAWFELSGNVYARRYAADGTPLGEQTRINLVTTKVGQPAVVALSDGRFMISWAGEGADGVRRTYGRVFPSDGLIGSP